SDSNCVSTTGHAVAKLTASVTERESTRVLPRSIGPPTLGGSMVAFGSLLQRHPPASTEACAPFAAFGASFRPEQPETMPIRSIETCSAFMSRLLFVLKFNLHF